MTNLMQTYSGKVVDLKAPTPDMISIVDIAHALSMTCRFGGHCKKFYSVAEHSVWVEVAGRSEGYFTNITPTCWEHCLALLLHDAAEAYIGDIITPVKGLVPDFAHLENAWLRAIEVNFGLGTLLTSPSPIVRRADRTTLEFEAIELLNPSASSMIPPDPQHIPTMAGPLSGMFQCWNPEQAKDEFLGRFVELDSGRRRSLMTLKNQEEGATTR